MVGKTMIVVNPASANGKTGTNWPQMEKYLLNQGLEFTAYLTKGPGDATILAREALLNGFTTIISVGGDGTLNETMNGFFNDNDELINPDAKLGVLSCGTGGDFIRTAGIPREFHQAVAVIMNGHSQRIDVGKVTFVNHVGIKTSRYFINEAGFGMDGEVVHRVNNSSKALGGFVSFLWGTVTALMAYKCRPVKLEIDGKLCYEGSITIVLVANGQYFGSGMRIAPMATLDSGHFHVVVVERMNKAEMLTWLPRIYNGTHINNPKVRVVSGVHIKAVGSDRLLMDVDGEQPGRLDAEYSIIPNCLPVIL